MPINDIAAYKVSDTEAPKPVNNPELRPLLKVFCTQSTPSGPNGIEAPSPTMIPFISVTSIILCLICYLCAQGKRGALQPKELAKIVKIVNHQAMNIKRNIKLWLLVLVSALLLSIPFLFPNMGLVALVAFVPLLAAEQIATQTKKRFFFIHYYVCFLLWNLATTWWIYNATVPGMIAAVTLNALQMAIIFRLFRWMRTVTKGFLPYMFLIITWLAWEHVYFNWEVSWPWLVLGNAFATSIKSIQWYEYTGTLGGSLWVLLFNTLLFRYICVFLSAGNRSSVENDNQLTNKSIKLYKRQNIIYLLSLALLFLVPRTVSLIIYHNYEEVPYEPGGKNIAGITTSQHMSDVKSGSRQFILLQPNIDPYKDKFRKTQADQNEILIDLVRSAFYADTDAGNYVIEGVATDSSRAAAGNVDFVIAPETFFSRPPLIFENNPLRNYNFLRVYNFTRRMNTNFIFGAVTDTIYFDYKSQGNGVRGALEKPTLTARYIESEDLWFDRSNTALFVDANGELEFYHKSKLVVLVESTPYRKLFNLMSRFEIDLGGAMGSYAPQKEREVFVTPDSVIIGTAICYESVYGDYYRDYILKGAQVMSIITNDGWWGDTPGYHQHLSYASLRAIETRRSIARSANTGISAFINQRGEIIAQTGWWERTYLKGELNLNNEITIFVQYGDIIGRLAGFLFFLLALMAIVRTISRKYITTAN